MGKKDRRRRRSSPSPPRKKEEKTEKKRRKSSSERPKKEGTKAEASDSEAPVAKLIPAAQVKAKEAENFAAQLDVPLVVSGCVNKTISEIVKGTYFRHGTNHGKPVYKKKPEDTPDDDDDLDVLIYYWDERDGEENCGWWFSPSVGGEMVWAYHPSRKATSPPPAEWNVPHDGPIDKSFTVTAAPQLAKESQRSLKKEEAKDKKDEDDDDEEEEEEEEEEEVDEEVSRPKAAPLSKDDGSSDSDARARSRKPKDSKDLTAEERELELQEAEDRRLMEQLRQREEARKKKAEELRMRKEQDKEPDRRGDDKEDKKKKKRPEKEKKKDKEEKRKREEEERERLRKDREREQREEEERRRKEEERRRRKEEEDRRLKEEEDRRRKREEERREEEERERRRRKEEERREEEEREERRRRKEEEERRRRREEEDRRRREEEEAERRREEERRRKREEEEEEERKRRRLIEEKEEAERARRKEKEKEERQKKEEERRKHEEKMQRKFEEEQKRREEEEKLRLEQEAKAKRQQAANLNVLKALQKLSDATPENWAQMSHDFQEIMRTELPETGDQREALQAEADRVFNYAQQYVKQMEERQKEQAERERIRLEELKVKEQNARQVLQEVEACLCKAEEEAQKARSVAEQLYQLANGAGGSSASSGRDALVSSFPKGAEEALRMGRVCLEAGKVAQLGAEGAWKVLEGHRMTLLELETLRQEMLVFVQRSEARLQACQMAAQQAVQVASESRERIQNNASPMLWDRKSGDIFRSYDQDEDGFLSRNEVMNFARMEYGFAIPAASLDRIFQQLSAPSAPGLEPTRFQQLRTSVGIARFESRVLRKAKKEEAEGADSLKVEAEYRQYLKQRKASVSAEVESIAWTDLESKVLEVESASASFVTAEKETQELQKFEAALDQKLAAARSALPNYLSQLRSLRHSTMQLIMVQAPKKPSEPQKEGTKEPKESEKAEKEGEGKEGGEGKEASEASEPKPTEAPGGEAPSGGAAGAEEKSQDSDLKELKELQGKLRELSLKLARLEARVLLAERKASEGRKVTARIAASLVEEVRVEVALKLRQCIEQLGGKAVDLFQIIAKGEDAASVEEAHAFLKENNCDMEVEKLARAFAACKEDTEKGSTKVSREEFAKIIRVVYEVKREVNLTETLAIGPAMRTLEVGEHLEVHAGPRAEPSGEGLQRLHVRALRDGALGWATLASSEGPYLVRS